MIQLADEESPLPRPGFVSSLVLYEATFLGEGSASAYEHLLVGLQNADGDYWDDSDCESSPPGDIREAPEIVAGETVAGSTCILVPTGEVGTLTIFVEDEPSGADSPVYWSTEAG